VIDQRAVYAWFFLVQTATKMEEDDEEDLEEAATLATVILAGAEEAHIPGTEH
jgi:hypothetical protein